MHPTKLTSVELLAECVNFCRYFEFIVNTWDSVWKIISVKIKKKVSQTHSQTTESSSSYCRSGASNNNLDASLGKMLLVPRIALRWFPAKLKYLCYIKKKKTLAILRATRSALYVCLSACGKLEQYKHELPKWMEFEAF